MSHTNTRLRRSPVNQCGHIIDPLPVPGSMGVGWGGGGGGGIGGGEGGG